MLNQVMKIEARFDASMLDDLRRQNEALKETCWHFVAVFGEANVWTGPRRLQIHRGLVLDEARALLAEKH